MKRISKLIPLFLVLIMALTAGLYFYRLGDESLSTDEYFSLHISRRPVHDIMANHRAASNPNTIPPLYEALLHYWLKIFGRSESAQRSLSAVFGVCSVYFIFRLGSLFFDSRVGILSALFGCFSYNWFSLSRQNRCYGLFILLVLISFYCFFRLIKNREEKRFFTYLAITNSLLLYTHYFSLLAIFLELVLGIFEWRKDRKALMNIMLMCAFIALAYAPWYSNFFYDLGREPIVIDRGPLVSLPRIIFDIFRIMFSDFHFIWSPILTIFYIPFIIMAVIKLKNGPSGSLRHTLTYLILILAVPFVFLYCCIFTDRARYYAPFMFPLFILLAYGIINFNIRTVARRIALLFIAVFIMSNNIMDFADFYRIPNDEEWKQAAALIKQIPDYPDKKNIFIFQTRYNPPVFSYYYWGPEAASFFIDNISKKDNYENNPFLKKERDKIILIENMKGKEFFKQLSAFPESSWIWVFRYHDLFFPRDFKMENQDRFFFHKAQLNQEMSPIDLFLVRRIKTNQK